MLHREPHLRPVRVREPRSVGQWWRSHGNEHWEFDDLGYMRRRDASINDYRIDHADRRIHVDRD